MDNTLTRWVYDRSPACLQNFFTTLYGWSKRRARYGRWYKQYLRSFVESTNWSLDALQQFQDEQVRKVVSLAWENVPYYRKKWKDAGIDPAKIQGVKDLSRLPLLEKSDVRNAGTDLLSKQIQSCEIRQATTSGSTGFPMINYWTESVEQREYGFHWARRRPGVSRGESYGSFTGLQLLSADRLRPPYWRCNYAANQTCYSVFHISPQTTPFYLRNMEKQRHVWLEGYPSPIAYLAKYIIDCGMNWPCPPKAVFVTAEELQTQHREWIEKAFRTRVFNQYGQNEKAGSITEYECGHLHYDMDYSVIEFLPVSEEPDGILAEMICTAFDNEAFPLIRYRIGDLALLPKSQEVCPHNPGPIIKAIYGRTAQSIVSSDGRRISNISVIVKKCHRIKAVQCVQHEIGKVDIRVVKDQGYCSKDEVNLLEQFRQKMGEMQFQVVYVDEIEKTSAGKTLSIVSKLNANENRCF